MDQVLKIKAISNPLQNANVLSKITFWYTFGTFYNGFFKKSLTEEDIPEILDGHRAAKQVRRLEGYWKREKSKKNPSLWFAIGRAFGLEYMMLGFAMLVDQLILRLLRSLSLIQLVKYFSQEDAEVINPNDAYVYGGLIASLSLLSIFISNWAMLQIQVLGMKIRVACSSLVYRKSLRLRKSVLEEYSVGHLTNLLSNDLGRLDIGLIFTQYLWIGPLDAIASTLALYYLVGYTSTIGMAFIVIWIPLLVFAGNKLSKLRFVIASKTDARVQLMNEIITGIKVIKMYTWEKPFSKLVDAARRAEVDKIFAISCFRGVTKLASAVPKFAIFIAVLIYVRTGNTISGVYIFATMCFYESTKFSMIINCVVGIMLAPDMNVSIKRVEKILLLEELGDKTDVHRDEPAVSLQEVTARWNENEPKPTLSDITLDAGKNQIVGIVGPVGSGKSSIFQVVLDELSPESGFAKVRGKISYASQEPWVFGGNVQQNILFGSPMNAERYNEVLSVCALEHDLVLLPYGDQTLVGERGVILSGGQKARVSLARAMYTDADIYLLDDPFSAVDVHVGNHIFQKCVKNFLAQKCVILITHQLQFLNNLHCIYLLEDGRISTHGTYEQVKTYLLKFSSDLLNVPGNDLEVHHDTGFKMSTSRQEKIPECLKEQRNEGALSNQVYTWYVKAAESWCLFLTVIVGFLIFHALHVLADLVLANWVNEQHNYDVSSMFYIYTFAGVILCILLASLFKVFAFIKFSTIISTRLHDKMFNAVVNAPMKFFHVNNSGRILNRFSKDVGIIDESIPNNVQELIYAVLTMVSCIVVICISNPWFVLVTFAILSVFYCMRFVYIRTGQNLTRIEGTARSPVFGHLNETLQGITTIRAYNAELMLEREFDNHLDFHSSVWSLFITCTKSFGFYIDLMCVIYITSVVFGTLLAHSGLHAGNVALAVTQSIGLIGLMQWGMFQSTNVQNQMTSVERIIEYTELKPEDEHDKSEAPPPRWPEKGAIRFESLSLKYSFDQPYVLKNVSMTIAPSHKIGIVGRTGAGKSSLITALFQLAKTEGAIYIDGIDITKMSTHSVRSKISIIPQDPVLFSGSVRKNLDPFGMYCDADLWSALDEVQLKSTVSALSTGLDHLVSNGGLNFSVGQRQLLCLARAIVRQNKILVLDEATANVDLHNDTLIQNTIKRRFADCTVLTIAHRLNTIMDSDKVLVMDAGEIVEYDHPHLLLQNKDGMFYLMLQKTGSSMASALSKIAEDSYNLNTTKL